MYAISLWQPWATLFCCIDPTTGRAPKEWETRSWADIDRLHGARVVIHAAKKWNLAMGRLINRADVPFNSALLRCGYRTGDPRHPDWHYSIPPMPALPLGALIGVVTIRELKGTTLLRDRITTQERAFGDWSDGRWAWRASDVRPFTRPVPWKGRQGLFTVPDDVVQQALAA